MYQSPVRTLMFILLFVPSLGVMHAQELKIVLAEGVGTDPQSAAQNAAQNALTNVVGSFIDANKQLEKRAEIANGIRTQTTQIKTDIREYSQGSIKSLEILDTKQDGSFFRVTAKVAVRVEDFRAYIKKLAEGETAVGGGLFAQMSTSQKQTDSLANLLSERVLAIINGEVVKFTVGKPIPYRNSEFPAKPLDNATYRLVERSGPDNVVVIPVTARLDEAFMENLTKTLESVAVSKKRVSNADFMWRSFETSGRCDLWDSDIKRGASNASQSQSRFCIPVMDGRNPSMATLYHFADVDHQLKTLLPWVDRGGYSDSLIRHDVEVPSLEVALLDGNGKELQVEMIKAAASANPAVVAKSGVDKPMPWLLYYPMSWTGGIDGVLFPERTFNVLMAVDNRALKEAASIRVKLIK